MPFQEFKTNSLERLLADLKNAKIPNSQIDVSTSEDNHHYACSKALVNILLYKTSSLGGEQEYRDLLALYQYCPACKNGARVL